MKNFRYFLLLGVLLTITTSSIASAPSHALPTTKARPALTKVAAVNGETKYLICHKGHQISVAASALPAHMAHGDSIGVCGGAEESIN